MMDLFLSYDNLEAQIRKFYDEKMDVHADDDPVSNHAITLYEKVRALMQSTLDENNARIIAESADDAINEFGNTNQEKKVELRKWKAQAELVLPPSTIEELRKRAEGQLLKKSYPKNVRL